MGWGGGVERGVQEIRSQPPSPPVPIGLRERKWTRPALPRFVSKA